MANSLSISFPSFSFHLTTNSLLITFLLLHSASPSSGELNNSSFSFNFAQNTLEKTNIFSLSLMVFSSISRIIPQNIWEAIQEGRRGWRKERGREGEGWKRERRDEEKEEVERGKIEEEERERRSGGREEGEKGSSKM